MRDLDDPPLDPTIETRPLSPERPRPSPAPALATAAVLVLVAVAGGWYWYRQRSTPAPAAPIAPDTAVAAPATLVPPATQADAPLPPLDASDPLVRELARSLSAHPQLAAALATDGLVRRFVVTVVALAGASSPASQLRPLAPTESFSVGRSGDRLLVDAASYRRYDALTAAFVSLDTAGCARLYRRLHPLFEQAYRDVGDPRSSFDQTLARAIGILVAAPIAEGDLEVVAAGNAYRWADPRLEGESSAVRHLLRFGPDNARRVQAKLRELAAALGLDVP